MDKFFESSTHLGVVNLPTKKDSDPVFWNQQWTSPSLIDDAEIIATKKLEIPMPQFPPLEVQVNHLKKTAMGNFTESTICVFSSSKIWGLLLFYESAWLFGVEEIWDDSFPIGSMYGIFMKKKHQNVGKHSIYGSYGFCVSPLPASAKKPIVKDHVDDLLHYGNLVRTVVMCGRDIWRPPFFPGKLYTLEIKDY